CIQDSDRSLTARLALRYNQAPFRTEPDGRDRAEAEGDQHGIRRDDLLGTGDRLRAATTLFIRCAQAGFHHLDALYPAFPDDGDGLAVGERLHPLFLGVLHLATRTRHVGCAATIGAGHASAALADP